MIEKAEEMGHMVIELKEPPKVVTEEIELEKQEVVE